MGQNLFLMSLPDVNLVNILLSITRVSLVQNKCVFCQLRVHFIGDPGITKTYLGNDVVKAETVTARHSRRLTRAPTRCWCTAISRLC